MDENRPADIKCSYEQCQKFFPTVEAMKKHKAKDRIHDYYCKRCDEDCIDDTWLFYHQITSSKHICCPACGREFRSEGGRDRHVDIDHVPKQKLDCAGCSKPFTSASSLMAHIESNECQVIKKVHFYNQRAEREISKDAWKAAEDPFAGTTILSDIEKSQIATTGPTLLDDERAWVEMDWAGNPIQGQEKQCGTTISSNVAQGLSNLSIDEFPILGLNLLEKSATSQLLSDNNTDLLGDDPEVLSYHCDTGKLPRNRSSGMPPTSHGQQSSETLPTSNPALNPVDDNLSITNSDMTTGQSVASYRTAPARQNTVLVPTANAHQEVNAHVTTAVQKVIPSYIEYDKYWDPLSENYACPGRKCGQRFATIDSFKGHLLSETHVDTSVSCPGCKKHFKTTTALIAHCESASRKCNVRHALDFDRVIRDITAGMISADGYQEDGSIKFTAQKIEDW